MHRIVPAIASLRQHLDTLGRTPAVYRPPRCPHCGRNVLWGHGCYRRQADRDRPSGGALNPIPIPRFYCQSCGRTCSRLPECIAPRRWYGWAVQQFVVPLLFAGCSLHRCACWVDPDRRTVQRWWQWLKTRSDEFGSVLRSRFPELGRAVDWRSFRAACLERFALGEVMAWLDRDGVIVP